MTTRILVPIAFSKYSKGIIDYAASLAGPLQAEMIIAYVIPDRDLEAVNKIAARGFKVDMESYLETIKEEKRQELQEMLSTLTLPDDKVTYTFCVGDPTNELLKLVVDREVSMVVMGVKTHDIRHIFTGSVAEQMFRKCPVTVVSYRDASISKALRKKFEKHRNRSMF